MDIKPLSIPGALLVTPEIHDDNRGEFMELYKLEDFRKASGEIFPLRQANISVSNRRALRGIHYTLERHGQGKYVTCVSGAVEDYIVDLRVGSPTFGHHEKILLGSFNHLAVYIPPGVGHAICALEDDTTLVYMCSREFSPGMEKEIWPFDPELGLTFWYDIGSLLVSPKDAAALRLDEARRRGLLPEYTTRHRVI